MKASRIFRLNDTAFVTFVILWALALITIGILELLGVGLALTLMVAALIITFLLDRKTNCDICGSELEWGECVKNEYCIKHKKQSLL